ncbi:MAG: GNAT family N-acetyltransferase [Solirubrobacterales bacterium]
MEARVATKADLEPVTQLLTDAFATDPLWSWAYPDRADMERWWRLHVESALRFPWTWVLGDFAAVAVWIPPGESELSQKGEARVESLVGELAGSRAPEILELLQRFEAAHPAAGPPHYYLTLLGADPARRGNGHGMALLEHCLGLVDEKGLPAYLESSNPGNDPRYERRGFRRVGGFNRPDEQMTVSTMWREARV